MNNQLKDLARFKQLALKAGINRVLFSEFSNSRKYKLYNSNFPAGQYMEIVMAWMLGYFCAISGINLRVYMTWQLDHDGVDFSLKCGFVSKTVNMKFNRPSSSDVADTDDRYDMCIRTWPAADAKRTQTGTEALTSILHCVLRMDIIEKVFMDHPDLRAILDETWNKMSVNW